MLNCVNSLEPQSMNSGIEHAALMISEEKTQHDSRKKFHNQYSIIPNHKRIKFNIYNLYLNEVATLLIYCYLFEINS